MDKFMQDIIDSSFKADPDWKEIKRKQVCVGEHFRPIAEESVYEPIEMQPPPVKCEWKYLESDYIQGLKDIGVYSILVDKLYKEGRITTKDDELLLESINKRKQEEDKLEDSTIMPAGEQVRKDGG
jgi:hypothetical protein